MHPDGAEAIAEEMAGSVVAPVEVLGVPAVRRCIPLPRLRLARLYEQMDMVAHQAIGEAVPAHAHRHARE